MSEQRLLNELSGIQALVLDVDDTLLDTRAAMITAGTAALGVLWPERAVDHGPMATRYVDDPGGWFARYASGELPFDDMRVARITEVGSAFGVNPPEGALARYVAAYDPAFRGAQRLFDDAGDLLALAWSAHLPVALLTNAAGAHTTLKLEALGLVDSFDAVVTTDTLGFGKPDPRVYLETTRLLGVPAGACVCVGDNLEWDVLGAETAGLGAVWLDRAGTGTGTAVAHVRDLHAVTAALRRVLDRRDSIQRGRSSDLGPRAVTGSIPERSSRCG